RSWGAARSSIPSPAARRGRSARAPTTSSARRSWTLGRPPRGARTHEAVVSAGRGLVSVPDGELETLLRRVHRGEVSFPLRRSELLLMKTPALAEQGDVLLGLDDKAVRAVLVSVLAERRAKRA